MNERILLVEDDKGFAEAIIKKLAGEGYEVDWAASGEQGLAKAGGGNYAVAVLDYMLPGKNGLETMQGLKKQDPSMPVIFITAHGDHELAWKSLQLGASEYINKPFNFSNLGFYVYKLIKEREFQKEFGNALNGAAGGREQMVFQNPRMEKLASRIPVYAASGLPVLISGETGTGKDLAGRLIFSHQKNPRRSKPFFAVNCMAIPDNLVESELFGHVKGAFTGALLDKKGFFEEADGGAIYLDEITGATPAVQGKLLRILESGEFYRVGDTRVLRTDVLVIASTSKDLFDEMESGRFRKDLFYRLNGLNIELPPLRERREDVTPLAKHFLEIANKRWSRNVKFSEDAFATLEYHDWPGNIRELKNLIFTVVSICEKEEISPEDLPLKGNNTAAGSETSFAALRERAIRKFEKDYFTALLKKTGGNVARAAREISIARQNFSDKIKKLGINPDNFR